MNSLNNYQADNFRLSLQIFLTAVNPPPKKISVQAGSQFGFI